MIKNIVVALDGSRNSFSAFEYAMFLAERTRAEIKVVFVVDSRKTETPIVYSSGQIDYAFDHIYIPPDPNLNAFYEKMRNDLLSFGKRIVEQCREMAKDSGIKVSGTIREGLPSSEIVEESRSGDILVIGQRGENAHYERTIIGSTVEDVVRTTPRPVIVSPMEFTEPSHMLILYDGSDTSERALQFVIVNFCEIVKKVTVAMIDCGRMEEKVEAGLKSYLNSHCEKADVMVEKGLPVESVIEIAERINANILALGAYGRHKVRDYLLGSTTSHLIRKSHLPTVVVR